MSSVRDSGDAAIAAPSPTSWGEIEPSLLEDVRAPVPAFPLDVLPPFWRGWVGATARSAGAPNDYVALSVLAAVAGIAGTAAQVRIAPRWIEPLVLWQAIVGPPSSGKSSAMAPVRDMLAALEARPPAGDGANRPCRVVDDVEIDDVAAALEAHPRGVILWRDEPADLLVGLGAEPGRRGDEALQAWWLKGWTGGPVTPGKGARRLNQFPVSLLFALLPERLAGLLQASPELAARFLFTWPHARSHVPIASRAPSDNEAALASLRRLADRLSGDPLVLAVDEAGLATFDAFTARLHAERSELEGLELAWLARGASTVARLAGALKLLEWSRDVSTNMPAAIGQEQIDRAIALWSDYFRPHALALFHHTAPTEQERRARQVVRWLQQAGDRVVSREDIRCKALRHGVNASQAEQVLSGLQNAGIVERAAPEESPSRGRPPNLWWVNPRLFETALAGNSGKSLRA